MEIRWKTLLTKSLIWLVAEIALNSLGLDTLADYSEFVFDKNEIVHLSQREVKSVVEFLQGMRFELYFPR